MSFFDLPTPRWATIAAHRPFVDDLARGLIEAVGAEGLAGAVVFLPTRRSARSLAEAFVAAAPGKAVLLPQIRALGDLDEDEAPFEAADLALRLPAAISPWRRRFELAGLVAERGPSIGRSLDAERALELADALGRFLDACQIEEIAAPDIRGALAEVELARHWEISADFIEGALEEWPRRLEALGCMDIWQRRVALLRSLAERWRGAPPPGVVIAAGSTGTTPAAADLMIAIARAPQGCVVLPGLDTALSDRAWGEVDEQHPQGALRRLIERAGVARAEVAAWSGSAEASAKGRWRRRLISEALKPPDETADWLSQIKSLRREGDGRDPIAEGLAGLTVIAARDEEEEARIAALLMREALETPGRTCALVSPDQALARRVTALMTRWGVTIDSSAGRPLALSPIAILLGLVAKAAADPIGAATLLAILKHPLVRLGLERRELETQRWSLERTALRGPPARSREELIGRIAEGGGGVELMARLEAALAPAISPYAEGVAAAGEAAQGLAAAVEALAAGPDSGAGAGFGELWSGLAGERAAALIAAVIGESESLPLVGPASFAELLEGLIAAEAVPGGEPVHPRLKILGVLEARLISADLVLLASLEEGLWPQSAAVDPFLSRPMRQRLGLPAPERRIGLAAHDFSQAAAASEVIMLHAERRGGAPSVQSRWLWRLQTLVGGAGLELPSSPEVVAWARALDAPVADPPSWLATAKRPAPTPPVSARPRRISVTGVETWLRDAYAIYARDILRLRPMPRPDQATGARERGSAVHAAFESFVRDHPGEAPDAAAITATLIDAMRAAGMPEANMAWERARAERMAPYIIAFETSRRPVEALYVEERGEMSFDAPGGAFTLSAKADRIELRGERADILDFKTGMPPSIKQVTSGISPQLTLTAAILAAGGFAALGPRKPGELLYVRVSGGRRPLDAKPSFVPPGTEAMAEEVLAKLARLVARFDHQACPYPSWPAPQFMNRWSGDYDHLARVWEWNVVGEDEEALR